jgi:hypothetical protein
MLHWIYMTINLLNENLSILIEKTFLEFNSNFSNKEFFEKMNKYSSKLEVFDI